MAITGDFEAIDREGIANPCIYLMADPLIAGHHLDYSSLDFCEEAADRIVGSIKSLI